MNLNQLLDISSWTPNTWIIGFAIAGGTLHTFAGPWCDMFGIERGDNGLLKPVVVKVEEIPGVKFHEAEPK